MSTTSSRLKKEEIVMRIYAALPLSNQITDLDLSIENVVRFTWRDVRFRVTEDLYVEQIEGAVVVSTAASILLEALLRKTK